MQIIGLGTDLVDIRRIEACYKKYGQRFVKRIFTPEEQKQLHVKKFDVNHMAKRWAAKEACFKAYPNSLNWQDMEVKNMSNGQPILTILNQNKSNYHIFLTLTDEYPYASSTVLIIIK